MRFRRSTNKSLQAGPKVCSFCVSPSIISIGTKDTKSSWYAYCIKLLLNGLMADGHLNDHLSITVPCTRIKLIPLRVMRTFCTTTERSKRHRKCQKHERRQQHGRFSNYTHSSHAQTHPATQTQLCEVLVTWFWFRRWSLPLVAVLCVGCASQFIYAI